MTDNYRHECPHCGQRFRRKSDCKWHIFDEHIDPLVFNSDDDDDNEDNDCHFETNQLVDNRNNHKHKDIDVVEQPEDTDDEDYTINDGLDADDDDDDDEDEDYNNKTTDICGNNNNKVKQPGRLKTAKQRQQSDNRMTTTGISVKRKAKQPQNQCHDCGQKFQRKTTLFKHMNDLNHYGLSSGGGGGNNPIVVYYDCPYDGCQFKTIYKRQIAVHNQRRHSTDRPFHCHRCDGKFKTKDDLRGHESVHQPSQQLRCEWPGCESVLKNRHSLVKHQKIHDYSSITGSKPIVYQCSWPGCDRSFSRNCSLKKHLWTHDANDAPEFRCDWPQCERVFRTNFNLKKHVMIHRQVKPFECLQPGCGKRFTEKANMMKHFSTHSIRK
ncbi:zinc finger protein 501-like [Oppia nitens]|uniref:zinc finger protein 501-like n=1 Tax=Oppia nitens TaxID=1686743 RepID=UPI0023DC4AFA|nr:zinc finger protein 501-like [Oppia nitens]